MRNAVIVLLLLIGCAKKDPAEQALNEFRGFRDHMCACTTRECRLRTWDEVEKWINTTDAGKLVRKPSKTTMTEEQRTQIDPIEAEIKRCKRGG